MFKNQIKIGILFGFMLGIVLSILSLIKSLLNFKESNWMLSILFLGIIVFFIYKAFKIYRNQKNFEEIKLHQFLTISFCIALISSSLFAFESYIWTFFHPEELTDLMNLAKQNWASRNYSSEIIAGQIEHQMYSSPISFAWSNFKILFFVNLVFGFFIAGGIILKKQFKNQQITELKITNHGKINS